MNKYIVLCVHPKGDTHERLELMGVKELECHDLNAPSCGHLYSKYFRMTLDQAEKLESFTPVDDYTLTEKVMSPVWGQLTLEYTRSSVQVDPSFLPTDFLDGVEAYTKVSIQTSWGQFLESARSDRGYSRFSYFKESVETHYCGSRGHNYAFDPNKWEFLPEPIPCNDVRKEQGLTAIWEMGAIVAYSYKLTRDKKTGEWEGVSPNGKRARWLSPPR